MTNTRKTYFYANTLEFNLPTEFIVSRNKRYIHVINCRCLYEDCFMHHLFKEIITLMDLLLIPTHIL